MYLFKLLYLPKGTITLKWSFNFECRQEWHNERKKKKKAKCRGNNWNISFRISENRCSYIRQCTQIMWFNSWLYLYLKTHLNVNRFSFASRAPLIFFFSFIVFFLVAVAMPFIGFSQLFSILYVLWFDVDFFFHILFIFLLMQHWYKSMLMPDSTTWKRDRNRDREQPCNGDLRLWTLPSAYNNELLTFIVW